MKKKISKIASLFLVAGLSLTMVTGCGSDKKTDDDQKNDKQSDKQEEKTVSAEDIANDFSDSSVGEIKLNGTNIKIMMDFSNKSEEQEKSLGADINLSLRTEPTMAVKADAKINGTDMEDMDFEGYMFVDEDGKPYVQVKMEDGTYAKSEIVQDQADQVISLIPKDTTLFNDEIITALATQIKDLDSIGKKEVDGKEYNALQLKLSEEKLSTVIEQMVPTLAARYGEANGISDETVQQYMQMIPKGYEEVAVEFYFDEDGVPAGVGIDLSDVVKSANGDEDAKAVITILVTYNNTDEITIPEAKTVDTKDLLG